MSNAMATRQTPEVILQQWQRLLGAASLNEPQEALIRAAIRYALPPISRSALKQAMTLYQADHDLTSAVVIDSALDALPINDKAGEPFAITHPLFYAMTDRRRDRSLPELHDPFQRTARRLLSQYFSTISPDIDADILYQDIQQCRDVFRALADLDLPPQPLDQPRDRYMIEQINLYLTGHDGIPADLANKVRRFQQLYLGINDIEVDDKPVRLPGVRKARYQKNGSHRNKQSRQKRVDSGLTNQLREALTAAQHRPHPIKTDQDQEANDQACEAQSTGWGAEFDQRSYRARASTPTRGESLDDSEITVARSVPSMMTRHDDRAVLHRAQRLAATDTLRSMTDIQRLTATQISDVLTVCRGVPSAWATAILLLTTGVPMKRLKALTVSHAPPGEPTGLPAPVPCWNPDKRILWYQLLDGPSGSNGARHRWVVLALPEALNQALETAGEASPDQPLRHAAGQLSRLLKKQFREISGLRPSPVRLTASSWMLIRPMARDDIAAQALSGAFGVRYGAPAAYRALLPGELDALFQSAVSCLFPSSEPQPSVTETGATPLQRSAGSEATNWRTGSDRAWPVSAFGPWFEALHGAFLDALRHFVRPLNPADRCPEKLLSVVHISAAHAYLKFLLATGCRPHGRRVRCRLVGQALWIADKDSPTHRESRVITVIPKLRDTLLGHQALLETTVSWLAERGYDVADSREPGQELLPARLEVVSRRRRKLSLVTMDHKCCLKLLEALRTDDHRACWRLAEAPRNVTRHSVTTYLRERVSEPGISDMLGHTGSGIRQSTPGSTALAPLRGQIHDALTGLLNEAGITPLPYQEVMHALR